MSTIILVCFGCDHPLDPRNLTHHSGLEDLRNARKSATTTHKIKASRFGCPVKIDSGEKRAVKKRGVDGVMAEELIPILERCACEATQPVTRERAETAEDIRLARLHYPTEVTA